MGSLRFTAGVEAAAHLGDPRVSGAVRVSAAGGRALPADVRYADGVLRCEWSQPGSGKVSLPWPVPGFGRPVLSTCTLARLPEEAAPYRLGVELARGTLLAAREQAAAARREEVEPPAPLIDGLDRAWAAFVRAACAGDGAESDAAAGEALAQACRAGDGFAALRAAERLDRLGVRANHPPVALAVRLGPHPPRPWWAAAFGPFEVPVIPFDWRVIEPSRGMRNWSVPDELLTWCETHGLNPAAGPLLRFGPGGLPGWLTRFRGDPADLSSLCCDFVESTLGRYHGRVRSWEVSADANLGGALGLDEPTRLELVARTLREARNVDEENRLFLRICDPFGDYLAAGRHRLAPIQFADALGRAGVGLDGLTLELAVGYGPTADGGGARASGGRGDAVPRTQSRTLFGYERMLADWSRLGVPLRVSLGFPSAPGPSGPADAGAAAEPIGWWRATGTEAAQAEWVEHLLPLLVATPSVVEVEWRTLADEPVMRDPHSGLLRVDGTPKPVLEPFRPFATPRGTAATAATAAPAAAPPDDQITVTIEEAVDVEKETDLNIVIPDEG